MSPRVEVLDLARCELRAMGTDVHVLVLDGEDADLHWAHAEIDRLERLWSRFRVDSEVSALNRQAGSWVAVAPETIDLLETAVGAWRATEGAFDPLLGSQVTSLGYDRSFEQVDRTGAGAVCPPPTPARRRDDDLQVDRALGRACVAPGRAVDLGGIAKGWTADLIATGLLARGAAGACVNLGGDVAVNGRAPHDDGWYVGLEHQAASAALPVLAVPRGGIATSTTLRRRWSGPGGDLRHHLLDPRRGTSCHGAVVEATVVASTAARAEALTKVAVVAPDLLDGALEAGEAALLTDVRGSSRSAGDGSVLRPARGSRPDAG